MLASGLPHKVMNESFLWYKNRLEAGEEISHLDLTYWTFSLLDTSFNFYLAVFLQAGPQLSRKFVMVFS